jgi:hypothetical protein
MGDLQAALQSYLGGIAVAEQLEAAARQDKYRIGLIDIDSATDITEESAAFLHDLLENAQAGELREFVCKVAPDQLDGLALYAEPEAADGAAVGALLVDAKLIPLARSPDGRWIHVQVEQTGERGWVPAGEEFVICNIDIAGLPVE